jgi:sortase A
VDGRTILRGTGKTFISAGVLILLFIAYQLWGTGIAEARSQHQLLHQFRAAQAPSVATGSVPTTTPAPGAGPGRGCRVPTAATGGNVSATVQAPLPPPPTGDALAIICIPKIHLTAAVVQGIGVSDLQKGPGHYPKTPMPGQPGNTAIAGHRTTYGHPFYDLDQVQTGDAIILSTHQGTFQYTVTSQKAVDPSDVAVVGPTPDNRLTLTTCTPRYTARQRLIVVARLDGPATIAPTPSTVPAAAGHPSADNPVVAVTDVGGLSGHGESTLPAVLWGVVCAAIWFGAWVASRRWRRWASYALGAPVFLVALYFFFENFARFVPANV